MAPKSTPTPRTLYVPPKRIFGDYFNGAFPSINPAYTINLEKETLIMQDPEIVKAEQLIREKKEAIKEANRELDAARTLIRQRQEAIDAEKYSHQFKTGDKVNTVGTIVNIRQTRGREAIIELRAFGRFFAMTAKELKDNLVKPEANTNDSGVFKTVYDISQEERKRAATFFAKKLFPVSSVPCSKDVQDIYELLTQFCLVHRYTDNYRKNVERTKSFVGYTEPHPPEYREMDKAIRSNVTTPDPIQEGIPEKDVVQERIEAFEAEKDYQQESMEARIEESLRYLGYQHGPDHKIIDPVLE